MARSFHAEGNAATLAAFLAARNMRRLKTRGAFAI
jgi:hypothetical protein